MLTFPVVKEIMKPCGMLVCLIQVFVKIPSLLTQESLAIVFIGPCLVEEKSQKTDLCAKILILSLIML